MKKLLAVPAYIWAVACLFIMMVTFINNDALAKQMAKLSFMKIHPKYQGGELNRSYEENGLKISVNKPVNQAVLKNSHKGYVQVTFASEGPLPTFITRKIDYDFNGSTDFVVSINTTNGKTLINSQTPAVKSLQASSRVKKNWVIRVAIDR
jgi:hypothetical protein